MLAELSQFFCNYESRWHCALKHYLKGSTDLLIHPIENSGTSLTAILGALSKINTRWIVKIALRGQYVQS